MARNVPEKKRPCKICRRWFAPDSRLGDRQKTYGAPECKREWHRRKCGEWNRKNSAYFMSNYLQKKLEAVSPLDSDDRSEKTVNASGMTRRGSKLPVWVVQEVISIQQLVIIEYLIQLSLRRFQEVIRRQVIEKSNKSR